jgi:hypothetical protein
METPVEAEDMDEGTLTDNSSASHEDHLSPRKISTPEVGAPHFKVFFSMPEDRLRLYPG